VGIAIVALALGLAGGEVARAAGARVPEAETAVIAETYRLVDEIGGKIWPGFERVPFPIVLVTEELELLVGWEGPPPPGFEMPAVHPRLGPVAARARVFSPELAAAFPAFGPPAVVAIGTMEATGRSSGRWALTLLHEHFHQLQYAAPDYQRDVAALDLSGDDATGMWMLNYPFPYGDARIGRLFDRLAAEVRLALSGEAESEAAWDALCELTTALEPADARYLGFQLWQEGVGRHLELRAASVAAESFSPGPDFAKLDVFESWGKEAAGLRGRIESELKALSLAESQRVSFYPVGAALAMLLDRDDPAWRSRYLIDRFRLESCPD
jgi:hypothetical protein